MADEHTLKKFIAELKSELDTIPKAKGRYNIKNDKGNICIITIHEFSEAVIRLHYQEVLSLEGFSEELSKHLNEVIRKENSVRRSIILTIIRTFMKQAKLLLVNKQQWIDGEIE